MYGARPSCMLHQCESLPGTIYNIWMRVTQLKTFSVEYLDMCASNNLERYGDDARMSDIAFAMSVIYRLPRYLILHVLKLLK
jgi:hypothetical protein